MALTRLGATRRADEQRTNGASKRGRGTNHQATPRSWRRACCTLPPGCRSRYRTRWPPRPAASPDLSRRAASLAHPMLARQRQRTTAFIIGALPKLHASTIGSPESDAKQRLSPTLSHPQRLVSTLETNRPWLFAPTQRLSHAVHTSAMQVIDVWSARLPAQPKLKMALSTPRARTRT